MGGTRGPWRLGERRPVALVYRGRGSTEASCAEAAAQLLRTSSWAFDVEFVGPREAQPLSAATLRGAAIYVQPGGGKLRSAYRRVRPHSPELRDYVASGGRYLGFCLGGYLAGATPGFGFLPGDSGQYIGLAGASVRHSGDTVIEVRWRGESRQMFFQDGPYFVLDDDCGAEVLARYANGAIAALACPFGRGRVAVVGPHPEATADWFEDVPGGVDAVDCTDLGHDLVNALMAERS